MYFCLETLRRISLWGGKKCPLFSLRELSWGVRESHAFFGAGKISRDRHKLRDTAFGFTLLKKPLFCCCKNDDFSGTQNEMFGEKSRHICKNVPFWQMVLLVKVRCLFSSSKKRFWPSNHWRSPEITPAVKPCVKTTEVSGCCEAKETYFLLERYQHVSTTGGLKMQMFFLQFAISNCLNGCIFSFAFSWNGCKFRLEKEVKTNVSCVSENFRRQL